MSFVAAVIAVLAIATVFLGLLAHNLIGRIEQLEAVIAGGLTAPTRPLAREEFARRWHNALARADFASQSQGGVYLFLDPHQDHSKPFLNAAAALTTGHDLTIVMPSQAQEAPTGTKETKVIEAIDSLLARGVNVLSDGDALIDELKITTMPFVVLIEDDRVANAAAVGNPEMVLTLLRQGAS